MGNAIITFTIRPRIDVEGDYWSLRDWCRANNIGISGVINAFIPAINYALHNNVKTGPDGTLYATSDFGDIPINGTISAMAASTKYLKLQMLRKRRGRISKGR